MNPRTGSPMRVERLDCPRGSVVVFKNKSAHAVEPKPVDSVTTRWNFGTVITNRLQSDVVRLRFHIDDPVQAWKNDGHTSHRGSMTPAWAQRRVRGSAGALMPPVTARDAVPPDAGGYAGPGYTNTMPGLKPRPAAAASSKL